MFNLIKDGIDVLFIMFVFYAGMRVQANYPNLGASIKGIFSSVGKIFTWLKGLVSKA